MSDQQKRLESIIEQKPQYKSKLEEDGFIDLEFIGTFIISAIAHVLIFLSLWVAILENYGSTYNKIVSGMWKKEHADIVFRLIEGSKKKGEFSYQDAQKLFNDRELPNREIQSLPDNNPAE